MENKKDLIIRILISLIVLGVLLIISLDKPNEVVAPKPTNECKEDSLQAVINQLQIDLETEEDGWDKKERRYDEIIFEYERGLEHLKHYYPKSYEEFHRIVGYKENFSREVERDNVKKLSAVKW
jgi:hypothetical protein